MNEFDQRFRLRAQAKDDLLMAAAALTQVPDEKVLGFAIFHAALGLLRLAQSDPQERGLEVAERWVQQARDEARDA